MILIPVKNLSNAKQRLASVLDQTARTELAHAMLLDVVDTVVSYGKERVALVTNDEFAIELAEEHGFEVIRDDANVSETGAIEMATGVCASRGAESTLVIPGDIPLIEAAEFRVIYDAAPTQGTVIVPSCDKRGTNAVLRRPAALFPLRFGNDSFVPHLAAAAATNSMIVVLPLPGIGLDIDTPDDLHELAALPGEKRSQVLARNFGFGNSSSISTADSERILTPAES